MRPSSLENSFAVFVLFFGFSLLEAVQRHNWSTAAFWVSVGTAFLVLGSRRKRENV